MLTHLKPKLQKNIGLLYKAENYLHTYGLKHLYFAYVYSYLNYANIAWGSNHKAKLTNLSSQQNMHALLFLMNINWLMLNGY